MSLQLKDPRLLRQQCHVGGEWRDAVGGGVIPVHNPADGQTIGTVPNMAQAETRRSAAISMNRRS
jgi:succinate-semialdehyde dehydrogenase/glutarate-semialdehyde dehydrogenase